MGFTVLSRFRIKSYTTDGVNPSLLCVAANGDSSGGGFNLLGTCELAAFRGGAFTGSSVRLRDLLERDLSTINGVWPFNGICRYASKSPLGAEELCLLAKERIDFEWVMVPFSLPGSIQLDTDVYKLLVEDFLDLPP